MEIKRTETETEKIITITINKDEIIQNSKINIVYPDKDYLGIYRTDFNYIKGTDKTIVGWFGDATNCENVTLLNPSTKLVRSCSYA